MSEGPYIAVDFDGTIVQHQFPEIGPFVPGARAWLRLFRENGARLILWTMRSDGQEYGDVLSEAVEYCHKACVDFDYVNCNPQGWTNSPKAYAHVYIDDAALGCPLVWPNDRSRPYVDWNVVGSHVMGMINAWNRRP